MSEVIKEIREIVTVRIGNLLTEFSKLENKYNLQKNNFTNTAKRYGVISKDGSSTEDEMQLIINDRYFEITLCDKIISSMNSDEKQEAILDGLESSMQLVLNDLTNLNHSHPSIILRCLYDSSEPVDFEEVENMAILRFRVLIKYKNVPLWC